MSRDPVRRGLVALVAVLICTVLCGGLLFSAPSWAQPGRSGLMGTAADPDGEHVPDLELSLLPAGETAAREQAVTTNRRGRFSARFLASGSYLIEVTDTESYFIVEAHVVIRDERGIVRDEYELTGHPERALGPFPVQAGVSTTVDLVVTDGAERERLRRALAAPTAPDHLRGELENLMALFNEGQMEQVVDLGGRLLAEQDDLPDAHHITGRAYARLERFDEAETHLRRAVELHPEEPEFRASLGTVLLEKARATEREGGDAAEIYGKAESWLGEALREMSPPPVPLLINRASALEGAGRSEDALAVMEEIVAAEPEDIVVRLRMASLLRSMGQPERALEVLEALPETSGPEAADTLYNVAVSFYDADDYDGALAALKRAEELAPEDPLIQRLLSRVYQGKGDRERAIAHLRRFLELAPDHPEAEDERELLRYLESEVGSSGA